MSLNHAPWCQTVYDFQGKRAELHLSKFGNGTNGKSIKYKGDWMTPEAYEQVRIVSNLDKCLTYVFRLAAAKPGNTSSPSQPTMVLSRR